MIINPYLCSCSRFPQPSYYPYPAPYYGVYPPNGNYFGSGIGVHAGGQLGVIMEQAFLSVVISGVAME